MRKVVNALARAHGTKRTQKSSSLLTEHNGQIRLRVLDIGRVVDRLLGRPDVYDRDLVDPVPPTTKRR